MSKDYPCKDCNDRYLGCHDKCSKYQSIKKDNLDKRSTIMAERKKQSDYERFRKSCIIKQMRRRG